MPDITFTCPKCDQALEAPEDYAGQTVACPGCGAEILVPEIASAPAAAGTAFDEDGDEADEVDEAADKPEDGEENVCPECGAEMEPDTVLCLGCGYHSVLGRKIQTDFDQNDDEN